MNPVLKYRGGKSREIPRFLQYIPESFDRYIEPFFGGGAVYFYLEPQKAIINDKNQRLINFYIQLRDNYPEMRKQLDEIQVIYEKNQNLYKQTKQTNPNKHVKSREAFKALMFKGSKISSFNSEDVIVSSQNETIQPIAEKLDSFGLRPQNDDNNFTKKRNDANYFLTGLATLAGIIGLGFLSLKLLTKSKGHLEKFVKDAKTEISNIVKKSTDKTQKQDIVNLENYLFSLGNLENSLLVV